MEIGWRGWLAVAVGLLAASPSVCAQKPSHDEERARDRDICGYQLMTERERAEYRERARRASEDALDQILSEHRERMQARAKERGVVLSCRKGGDVRQIREKGALNESVGGAAGPFALPVVAMRDGIEGRGGD